VPTVEQALGLGRERLRGSESARGDAALLLGYVLEQSNAWLLAHGDEALEPGQSERFERALARRAAGEPVAYIIGRAGFYGRLFAVTPDVLIPRPETEELLERALAFLCAHFAERSVRVCDVGTGSGALAVSLALEVPTAEIVAIDISPTALAVARRNAFAFGVAERVRLVEGDARGVLAEGAPFDAVVANLPYVRTDDLPREPDSAAFEPRLALDGGVDGLAAYRDLLACGPNLLAAGGMLFMEGGPDTLAGLVTLAARTFDEAARVTGYADYGGRQRVVEVLDLRAPEREPKAG